MSEKYAYLAGLIDGDGCIYISDKQLKIEITSNNKDFLEQIRYYYQVGRIYAKPIKGTLAKSQPYQLRITGRYARSLLIKVSPFLVLKYDFASWILKNQHLIKWAYMRFDI